MCHNRGVLQISLKKKGLRGKRRGGDVPVTPRVIEWRLARETEVPSRDGESEKIELRQLETGQGGVCEWKARKKNWVRRIRVGALREDWTLWHHQEANDDALSAPTAAVTQICSLSWEEWPGHPFLSLQLFGGKEIILYILTMFNGGLDAVCLALGEGAFPCCRQYYRPRQVTSLSLVTQSRAIQQVLFLSYQNLNRTRLATCSPQVHTVSQTQSSPQGDCPSLQKPPCCPPSLLWEQNSSDLPASDIRFVIVVLCLTRRVLQTNTILETKSTLFTGECWAKWYLLPTLMASIFLLFFFFPSSVSGSLLD